MKKYPYLLSYVTKDNIWGGTALLDPENGWNVKADTPVVGEAWKLTVRAKENSRILNGEYAGKELGEVLRVSPELIGNAYKDPTFPLLIKLIDAQDNLSVQVHPDDAYAARVENDRGKTEMWVILDAKPGASIVYGLRDGLTAEDFKEAVMQKRYASVLNEIPVKKGDVFFIPSGMLHAIGKGILIAEIQQNCDLTYRVWDYDRRQADGSLRALHVEKALDVVRPFSEAKIRAIQFEAAADGETEDSSVLAHCRYFKTERLTTCQPVAHCVPDSTFHNLLCIEGEGTLITPDGEYPIRKGDNYYLPAGLGSYTIEGHMVLLRASI